MDIVKVERFEKFAANPDAPFMQRIFTLRERDYLKGKTAQSIAGIFAAKEAVAKAIGTGFRGFHPSDIEILHKNNGKPYAVLSANAKKAASRSNKRARRFSIAISISHTTTDAIAYAVCFTKYR